MISIVICHRSINLLEQFKRSLAETIGLEYELIVVDNSTGRYGICQAYNLGGKQAKYDLICFVHEDILFHTQNWGKLLLQHFNDPSVGAVGVAGSKIFGKKWFTFGGNKGFGKINILQHTPKGKIVHLQKIDPNAKAGDVVSLDGVFIACRKSIFENILFDEVQLKNFHCYDMDFSLRVSQQSRVQVAYDILIEHISTANYDARFFKEFDAHFMPKWKGQLPLISSDFDPSSVPVAEWYLFLTYAKTPMMRNNFGRILKESLQLFTYYPRPFLMLKILTLIVLDRFQQNLQTTENE
jgi:Glycosyltransferase like family